MTTETIPAPISIHHLTATLDKLATADAWSKIGLAELAVRQAHDLFRAYDDELKAHRRRIDNQMDRIGQLETRILALTSPPRVVGDS